MRRLSQFLVSLFLLTPLAFDVSAERTEGPQFRDIWAVESPAASSPREAATLLLSPLRARLAGGDSVELAAPSERVSLTGSHFRFAQKIGVIPVLNGGVSVSVRSDGTATIHDRTGVPASEVVRVGHSEATAAALASARSLAATDVERVELVAWVGDDGIARTYQRVILVNGLRRYSVFVGAESGCVAWTEPLFATARGQVFDSNPVTTLNEATLLDGDDSDSSVPAGAYASVELPGLSGSGQLAGPHAKIVDVEIPTTAHADQSSSLEFTRSSDEFEEVNTYFQIDRSQRYLEGLGFVGDRAIVAYPIEIDAHAGGGVDDSSYRFSTPGSGRLYFGDGGVDDAEDADIVLHEFGHAIQDSIVPSGFTGPSSSEPRALGEGFSDYWAFSSSWTRSKESGRDPFCIGDWDARCAPGPSTRCGYEPGTNCLRRVDGTKTMADYIRGGGSGTEHANGEIWSSALREIFVKAADALGDVDTRRLVDRTILESFFGMPPNPSFRTAALRLIDADRRLNKSLFTPSICVAMSTRGIIESSDCDLGLRGDLTLVESPSRNVAIPDNDANGVTSTLRVSDTRVALELFVRVNIEHPRRGDLRLTLIAPDGANVVLQVENGDSGADIRATYGLDAEPSQPLSALAGKSAAGVWTLRVTDTFGADAGQVVSWGMMFRFAGDAPITTRSSSDPHALVIPVVGNVGGSFGTHYLSDARIANIGVETARATLFFTPSGADGSTKFSAVKVEIPPAETIALDDIVTSLFHEAGTGSIEIRGDTASLLVTTRIYNGADTGTYGQFVRVGGVKATLERGELLHVLHLSNGATTRSNLGITEVAGGSGIAEIKLLDASGTLLATEALDVAPYSHRQILLLGGPSGTAAATFRAEVKMLSGAASVIAYGSVVDNSSGDAILVPGWSFNRSVEPPALDQYYVIPAVIRADGAVGTQWRSDLRILNLGGASGSVVLKFNPADGSAPQTASVPLNQKATAVIDDVVASVFGRSEGRGSLEISLAGSADSLTDLVVTSRTWTQGLTGTYGQFIPAIPKPDATGAESVSLIHIDSTAAFRCNVGLSEVAGASVVVRVRLLAASGVERFATDVPLPAHGNAQFNLSAAGAPEVSNGRLTFQVIDGSGSVLPYASVIDNESGDPIFVSP